MRTIALAAILLTSGIILVTCTQTEEQEQASVELRVGLSAEPTTVDPHYHDAGFNKPFLMHIYEGLTFMNAKLQVEPGLAAAWELLDETTWRFTLRKDVLFQDGSEFTATDVVYSIGRIPNVLNSPSPFTPSTRSIADIQVVDDYTVDFITKTPYPLLPNDLTTVMMISAPDDVMIDFKNEQNDDVQWLTNEDFTNGTAAIGTGPFALEKYEPGNEIVLTRFDRYWGGIGDIDKLYFYPMPDNAARTSALLSGQVDIIENVPSNDIERLIEDESIDIVTGPSSVIIFFAFDQHDDNTPKITGTDGKNPFLDKRVREAFNYAVNVDAIVNETKRGIAAPAISLVPQTVFGYTDNVKKIGYDLEKAKELMQAAGWEDGFQLIINAPSDRYTDGVEVAQVVAQMLSQINVDVTVETFPRSIYFSKASNFEYSMYMGAAAADNGDASQPLRSVVHTRQTDRGYGGGNRGRYSSATADEYIEEAEQQMDLDKREELYGKALEIFHNEDVGLMPLYFQVGVWGVKTGIIFEPRMDQGTVLRDVTIDY